MDRQAADRAVMLPTGVFEMPPERAAFMRRVEEVLLAVFKRRGYQEVRTPALEYLDTMALGLTAAELDMAFKLVDRSTGRMMVLRTDVTPQVARMAAQALRDQPRPLRMCYVADVYRHAGDPSQPRRELIQAGAELIGQGDPKGDAELVALAVESLRGLGAEGVRISLGQVRYAAGLLAALDLGHSVEDRLMAAAHRKDAGELARILDEAAVPRTSQEPILGLARLGGGSGGLDAARKKAKGECRRALDNLSEVLDLAAAQGVEPGILSVDLGDVASFRYHTGVVFTGYVAGSGRAVLRGGRYDNLVGRYGAPSPATGFGIDILELAELVALPTQEPDL